MLDNEPVKECSDCGSILTLDFFKPNPRKADGLNRYCVTCERTRKELYTALLATNDPQVVLE